MGLRNIMLGALAVCAVAVAAEDVQAFWGSRGSWGSYGGSWGSSGSSGGSYGSSGGSYGSSGGSYGSSGGSYGSSGGDCCGGRFLHRLFHRGSDGSCGSSGGSYGSSGGSSGGSYSYGSNGSSGGYAGYSSYSTSNEVVSTSTDYGYVVKSDSAPAKTKLTLRVPADAKVTLAGVATKQTGEVREFATGRLAAGQAWNNYTIQVAMMRDGKMVTEERTITLTGGQAQELSFASDGGSQLAAIN